MLIRDEHGTPMYWLGLMLDMTDDAATRGQLHEARSKYGALVEQIPAIVYVDIADEQMTTTYVSPQILPLLGYTARRSTSRTPTSGHACCIRTTGRRRSRRTCAGASSDNRSSTSTDSSRETTVCCGSGTPRSCCSDADGKPALIQGVMLDITERKAAEEQIAYLAYHDKLTGMANRAMFDELLGALAHARAAQRLRGRGDLGRPRSTSSW